MILLVTMIDRHLAFTQRMIAIYHDAINYQSEITKISNAILLIHFNPVKMAIKYNKSNVLLIRAISD